MLLNQGESLYIRTAPGVYLCVCMCTCFPKGSGSEVKKWGRGWRQVKLEKG